MSFLVRSRLFQAVSGRFLLVVGRSKSFFARCRSFQVVSCLFQVVSDPFLLMLGCFRSLQVVLGCFRSFRVLVSTRNRMTILTAESLQFAHQSVGL